MSEQFLATAGIVMGLTLTTVLALAALHILRRRDRQAAHQQMIELARLQAETGVRIEGLRDVLVGRQAELHRAVNERLELRHASPQSIHDQQWAADGRKPAKA